MFSREIHLQRFFHTLEMAINTAIDMLRDDEPIEKIIKYSRLTEEQIRELASQIQ